MFSEYCKDKFTIEPVVVMDEDENQIGIYPIFENREVISEIEYINRGIGITLEPETIVSILSKMGLPAKLSKDKKSVIATITPTRTDIFHKCDLVEDVAIAYGFNNIKPETSQSYTTGSQYPLNNLSDKIRGEVARSGYIEILTFSLISEKENFTKLRKVNDGTTVVLSNPATTEFEVVRTSLLPCLLKTLHSNKDVPLPLAVYEVSDVVMLDNESDVGATNKRQLCAVYCDTTSQFELIHGLLDKLMVSLGYTWKENNKGYIIKPSENPTFLEGRSGDIIALDNGKESKIGEIGTLHPEVILNFELLCSCSALILDIEYFK